MLFSSDSLASNGEEWTVVAKFTPEPRKDGAYQSEAGLEKTFIRDLKNLGYEFLDIHNKDDLKANLRKQMERLNTLGANDGPEGFRFEEDEWKRFYLGFLAKRGEGVLEKTEHFQNSQTWPLYREDKLFRNLMVVDKKNIHRNVLQVIHQYEEEHECRKSRYDVTILLNGLPMVHIELKRRGKMGIDSLREAFNQIERYQDQSFWSGDGLFNWVQLFVISNGTFTRYYSNTLRLQKTKHIDPLQDRTRKSFDFTFHWADQENTPIHDLEDFTKTFFRCNTLLNLLIRYCVLDTKQDLKVMRPYQIVACEKILNRIRIAINCETFGKKGAGGYIWHTTGTGKTLTSFKTAQLVRNDRSLDIDKVLFVVDRKDLDSQTVAEYNKFEKGYVAGSSSTKILDKQLTNNDEKNKIIVTTIQKLGYLINQKKSHPAYQKRIVFIFDECHRSQFGKMNNSIINRFKKNIYFGFTGTPIFKKNASKANPCKESLTTEQIFGECLHNYTIIDAIRDRSVLKFNFQQYDTFGVKDTIEDKRVRAINREEVWHAPERRQLVVQKILEVFDAKTKRNKKYKIINRDGKQGMARGFNALFAVDSIKSAIDYYEAFKKQLETTKNPLKIATIFTYPAYEDPNKENDREFNQKSMASGLRDALEKAIQDYNRTFGTEFSIDGFDEYRTDLSEKIKNGEVDLTIVVNIFLTGFDSPRLNTLFVDRNLEYHGLIQAFSRTNRILNECKEAGNIVCFRDLKKNLDDALRLFGVPKDSIDSVLMRSFEDYYEGYDDKDGHHHPGYKEVVQELRKFDPKQDIVGEEKQKEFIEHFNDFLERRSFLGTYDEFTEEKRLVSDREQQDYASLFNKLSWQFKREREENPESIKEDVVFKMELVQQFAVDIQYILSLSDQQFKSKNKSELYKDIERNIDASPFLLRKKSLIMEFVKSEKHSNEWSSYVRNQKENEIKTIVQEEHLDFEKTKAYVEDAFDRGEDLSREGTDFVNCLPENIRDLKDKNNRKIRDRIWKKIKEFFDKFFGLFK